MVTYNIDGLKELLHLGRLQAETLMKSDGFPSIRIGRIWLVEEDALKNWMENTKSVKLEYYHKE